MGLGDGTGRKDLCGWPSTRARLSFQGDSALRYRRSNMKYLQSGLHRDEPIHLLATSEFPPPARISEPAKTLLVVDDDRMVRGLETQILRLQGYTVL